MGLADGAGPVGDGPTVGVGLPPAITTTSPGRTKTCPDCRGGAVPTTATSSVPGSTTITWGVVLAAAVALGTVTTNRSPGWPITTGGGVMNDEFPYAALMFRTKIGM